ncbi:MAG: GNAT family N-acetyltransferase [Muribaculaceae bacterium]|nr:GNAT family N-acetyltransferase [Muribaculaceae bacterium]
MKIRKGLIADISAVSNIYNSIHDEIEQGRYKMLWHRDLYPTRSWAEEHIADGDLYVMEDNGVIVASAIINHTPLPEYHKGAWYQPDNYNDIMVLHTLVVHPKHMRRGYASAFVDYYEKKAKESGCNRLRLDTQMMDVPARNLYKKRGYVEIDNVPCQFQGISDIDLVLIEKLLL